MRLSARWRGAVLGVIFCLGCARGAFADGGRLRFREPAGPFEVTLFTTPDPLTRGEADFSVAVERAGEPGLVQDAQVDLLLTRADGKGGTLVLHASHAAATSKWLQAANFSLPAAGVWRVTVQVRRGQETGACSGEIHVRAAGARDWTWDVLPVPLAGLFLVLHANRKRKYRRERRRQAALAAARNRASA
ncbi:MAG TPA: hypothetical protein VHU89_14900 [Acidobacteriaceae bacterium]|jgi:hypothetical protein|nr:hypothetical protein [Acidobacteriaceae bacterium]